MEEGDDATGAGAEDVCRGAMLGAWLSCSLTRGGVRLQRVRGGKQFMAL